MKIRSIKLPKSLDRSLYERAAARGVSGSAVVREALTEYLTGAPKNQTHGPLSVAMLAADLAGCAAGPADLSTNSFHMSGYGAPAAHARPARRSSARSPKSRSFK